MKLHIVVKEDGLFNVLDQDANNQVCARFKTKFKCYEFIACCNLMSEITEKSEFCNMVFLKCNNTSEESKNLLKAIEYIQRIYG